MARKRLFAAFTIAAVCNILIITIPATTFLVGFSNYGKIDETSTFYYLPSNFTPVEELSLNTDVGNIEVQYITTPTNYYVKVDVNVEIICSNVEGKSYLDFFDIDWQNNSSPIAFSMVSKSDPLVDSSSWTIKNLSIIVTLRADIAYDLNLTVLEGNTEILVPFGVFVNNIAVRSFIGNIKYDFNYCVIGGNITGNTTNGNIILNAYDVEYFQDSTWVLTTEMGDIDLDILQYNDMGANVTCRAETTNGSLYLTYKDSNPDVGAMIETDGIVQMWRWHDQPYMFESFEGFQIGEQLVPPRPNEYFSDDYPTNDNYEMLLIKVSDDSGKIYLLELLSS